MCNFKVDVAQLRQRFGEASGVLLDDIRALYAMDGEGLVSFDGERLAMTERGRPFVRAIAAVFDAYLETGKQRHSVAV